MLTHIHTTAVSVANYEEALAFYTEKLGWEKREDVPMGGDGRWLTVAIPGAQTSINLAGPEMHGEHTPGGMTGIAIISDDIDADYERLVGAGVSFTGPVTTEAWGDRSAWMTDPDGNVFYLIQSTAAV